MARAIQPFSTASDGDVLFAVTTDEIDNPMLTAGDIGIIAAELAWDAILSSVPVADRVLATTRIKGDPASLDAYVGTYELGPAARLTIARAGDHLVARSNSAGMYIPPNADVPLIRLSPTDFLIDARRHDVIRFERKGSRAGSLAINPGNWAARATRIGNRR